MNSQQINEKIISYLDKLKQTLNRLDLSEINQFLALLMEAYQSEKQIFIMGNGGSASTASHFACDINKGVSFGLEKRFKVICLNDNIPTIMAYSNDCSYEDIFIEQLKNFLNPNDIVIGISGSGNSKNIIKAIEYANQNQAISVGVTGYNGGILKQIAKYSVNANVDDMQISEDIHLILNHLTMKVLCHFILLKE